MDFIPGFRLIHVDELQSEKKTLDAILAGRDISTYGVMLPLLANYSSDFVCYLKTNTHDEQIGLVMHDNDSVDIMHSSIGDFLSTLCAFYEKGVYFLDEDGYLDSDFDKEGEIGCALNNGLEYWLK